VDLTGSEFVRLFDLQSQDLVFRVYPFLFGMFALFGVIKLSFTLMPQAINLHPKRKVMLEIFTGILMIGGGSLAFLLPIIGWQSLVHESAFWMHQSISTWVNLPLGVSFSLFIATLNVSLLVFRKPTIFAVAILGLLIGSHLGIKAYGGVLMLIGGLYTGIWLLHKRLNMLALLFFIICTFSFLVIARSALGSEQSAGLEWNPGWFVKTMFEASDRINFPRWELKRLHYTQKANYLGLIALWVAGIIIFVIGNLGSRLFGLYGMHKMNNPQKGQFLVLFLAALLFPLLFTQSGVGWNTIQFGYYAYLLLTPLVIVALAQFKRWGVMMALLIGVMAIPTTIFTIANQLSSKNASSYVVSKSDLEVLMSLKQLKTGSVLAPYEDKAIIPAISGKPCYFCNQTQSDLLQLLSDDEKDQVNRLFDSPMSAQEIHTFMQQNAIVYLYIPEFQESLPEHLWSEAGLGKIASSGNASVYALKP
jgi:hypothetical protein